LIIRSARPDDLEALVELERRGIDGPWSPGQLRAELDLPVSLVLVAKDETGVSGYAVIRFMEPEAELLRLVVHPGYRRQGVAGQLLASVCMHAVDRGVETCFLEVRSSNVAALRLYQGLGFSVCGRRPNYFDRPVEDALLMKKEFSVCRRKDENNSGY
jgi:ribosomal-protein-alanine N-acetyltransferase